jgi:anti-anti-sigma factor
MAAVESPLSGVSRQNLTAWIQRDAYPTVVWLQGEHNTSDVAALCQVLAEAISLTNADKVVLDLSGVESMSSAAIIVILKTRDLLEQQCRSLILRSPSSSARHLCALCGIRRRVTPKVT